MDDSSGPSSSADNAETSREASPVHSAESTKSAAATKTLIVQAKQKKADYNTSLKDCDLEVNSDFYSPDMMQDRLSSTEHSFSGNMTSVDQELYSNSIRNQSTLRTSNVTSENETPDSNFQADRSLSQNHELFGKTTHQPNMRYIEQKSHEEEIKNKEDDNDFRNQNIYKDVSDILSQPKSATPSTEGVFFRTLSRTKSTDSPWERSSINADIEANNAGSERFISKSQMRGK